MRRGRARSRLQGQGACIALTLGCACTAAAAPAPSPDPGPITRAAPPLSAAPLERAPVPAWAPLLSQPPTGSPARSLVPPLQGTDDLARLQAALTAAAGDAELYTPPELESLLPGDVELRLSARDVDALRRQVAAKGGTAPAAARLRARLSAEGYVVQPPAGVIGDLRHDNIPLTFRWRLSPRPEMANGELRPGPIRVSLALQTSGRDDMVFLVLERPAPDLPARRPSSPRVPGWATGAVLVGLGLIAAMAAWRRRAAGQARR